MYTILLSFVRSKLSPNCHTLPDLQHVLVSVVTPDSAKITLGALMVPAVHTRLQYSIVKLSSARLPSVLESERNTNLEAVGCSLDRTA